MVPANADAMNDHPAFCVYTALTGAYERLNEQPVATAANIPFICLTDDVGLRSKTWQIRRVDMLFPMDPVRSQRALKLCPHRYLPDFDCSLYIDNCVLLSAPPERLIEQFDVAADRLVSVAPAEFSALLADKRFYNQDVVPRRKAELAAH
jgi:hypothetical protein